MADDLHLRRYRPDDRDAVWAVHERAFRASPLPFVERVAGRRPATANVAPIDEDLRRIESAYLESCGEFLVGCVEPRSTDSASGERAGHDTAERPNDLQAGDGEVVAVGGFVPVGDGAIEIKRIRVDPDHQRNGYGAAVLSALEDAARRAGYERAVLETHELLAAAQALYESRGYRETGRESGRDGYDRIRYEKVL